MNIAWAVDKDWLWVHFAPRVRRRSGSSTATARCEGRVGQRVGHGRSSTREGRERRRVRDGAGPGGSDHGTRVERARVPAAARGDRQRRARRSMSTATRSPRSSRSTSVRLARRWPRTCCRHRRAGRRVAAAAPASAQWNLDLDAVTAWLAPCAKRRGTAARPSMGVRSARALVLTLDPGDKSGTGAVVARSSPTASFSRVHRQGVALLER